MGSEPVTPSLPIRILLVDDHPAVRQGMALLLASVGFQVCAEAEGRSDALAHVKRHRPDLAIVDLSLDGEDGGVLVADLAKRGVPVLVYSMHSDTRHVEGAFAAGALGYVTKRELHNVLFDAIQRVAAGKRFVSPQAATALAVHASSDRADHAYFKLSFKERQVYRLLGQGAFTPEISAALEISPHTVESYCARILVKLGLNGVHELRRHAIAHFQKYTP